MASLDFSTVAHSVSTYVAGDYTLTVQQGSGGISSDGHHLGFDTQVLGVLVTRTDGHEFSLTSVSADLNNGDVNFLYGISPRYATFPPGGGLAEQGLSLSTFPQTFAADTDAFGDITGFVFSGHLRYADLDGVQVGPPAALTAADYALAVAYGHAATALNGDITAPSTGTTAPITVTGVDAPSHGTATINAAGDVTYTPYVGYVGADIFGYTESDGAGTAAAQVNVAVAGLGGAAAAPSYIYGGGLTSGQTFDVSGDGIGHQVAGSAYGDVIHGGAKADSLNGYAGNDVIYGGAGNDVIIGGAGADTVSGGAGADTFVIAKADIADPAANGGHLDHVMDFEGAGDGYHPGQDILTLKGFSSAATLTLDAAATAASSDSTAHYYAIADGAFHGEIVIHYVGSAVLVAGDYAFT